MNEKLKKNIYWFIGIVICFVSVYLTGCQSARPVIVATDESIISSQVSVERIGSSNEGFGELLQLYDEFFRATTSGYDELIREAHSRASAGNLDAQTALDLYDEFVQGLIYRIRELEYRVRTLETRERQIIEN